MPNAIEELRNALGEWKDWKGILAAYGIPLVAGVIFGSFLAGVALLLVGGTFQYYPIGSGTYLTGMVNPWVALIVLVSLALVLFYTTGWIVSVSLSQSIHKRKTGKYLSAADETLKHIFSPLTKRMTISYFFWIAIVVALTLAFFSILSYFSLKTTLALAIVYFALMILLYAPLSVAIPPAAYRAKSYTKAITSVWDVLTSNYSYALASGLIAGLFILIINMLLVFLTIYLSSSLAGICLASSIIWLLALLADIYYLQLLTYLQSALV